MNTFGTGLSHIEDEFMDESIYTSKSTVTSASFRRATIARTTLRTPVIILFCTLFVILCFSAAAEQAQAALGGPVDSLESDRKVLSAVYGSTAVKSACTVRKIVSDATTLNEYISPSGRVFGITWKGLAHPDLTQLLGSYAEEYQNAMRQVPRQPGGRYIRVNTNRIVVEKWGHMRNLQGRAYVPDLIPQGVSVDEIK